MIQGARQSRKNMKVECQREAVNLKRKDWDCQEFVASINRTLIFKTFWGGQMCQTTGLWTFQLVSSCGWLP